MSLTLHDFPKVFRRIHGDPPFAWQTRLLQTVVAHGWPDTVAAPTGAGKTAVLDVALFHLALEAGSKGPRQAARRIVMAVDRRIVVDQAFERAKRIRDILRTTSDSLLDTFATALRTVAGGTGSALHVEELRGGMPREDDWAREPAQPTILCTTIDQLGSRLLFRGYGVSPSMAPVHAGLLGEDALLLLDEAHLSGAFRETLGNIRRRRNKRTHSLSLPWSISMLTATPGQESGQRFDLTEAEREEPTIARRLSASKWAELRLYDGDTGSAAHAAMLAAAANDLIARCVRAAPTIAIVVNRVRLARDVLAALRVQEKNAILLTGRARPIGRDAVIRDHAMRLLARRDAEPIVLNQDGQTGPLFVVATQCIEAGADFDFDAMVTQIAPLDALQQRFGRLNRLGSRAESAAVIIAAKDEIGRTARDPLYRDLPKASWEWLNHHAAVVVTGNAPTLDICTNAWRTLIVADAEAAAACIAKPGCAPVLRAADVALFATTSPVPSPDPYLPMFLHGTVSDDADVSIVWRGDCAAPTILHDDDADRLTRNIVGCVPPRTAEALRVPFGAAKAWLASIGRHSSSEAGDVADIEGGGASSVAIFQPGKLVFRWRGPDSQESRWIALSDLRPGTLVVVPASYGGCDAFGWAPAQSDLVEDLADEAAAPYASRYLAMRLHPALWPREDGCLTWADAWPKLRKVATEKGSGRLWEALQEDGLPTAIRLRAKCFDKVDYADVLFPYAQDAEDQATGAVLIAPRGVPVSQLDDELGSATSEDDLSGSFAGQPISLERHVDEVVTQATRMADAVGLPDTVARAVRFAARHHDDGKADPRFQAWLQGLDVPSDTLLAKSGRRRGPAEEQAARLAAGVPPHWRHEALSVRAAILILATSDNPIDAGLALYLIGTHHGQGRPFFVHNDPWDDYEQILAGSILAPGPGPERLDFDWHGQDWPGLFTTLHDRYGAWGLAFLEALLRLADHRASEKWV